MSDAENVGGIVYTVGFETGALIAGQREIDRAMQTASSSVDQLDKSVQKATSSMTALTAVAIAVSAALSSNEIIKYADAWTTFNNKLANSIKEGETQAEVTQRIFDISQKSRTSLETICHFQDFPNTDLD